LLQQSVNGWAVSGVTTIQSGDRLTITDSLGGSIFGSVSTARAQLCPGVTDSQIQTRGSLHNRLQGYFNNAAFCAAPALADGTGYGNSSVGVVRGPEQNNTDLTVSRVFHLFSDKRTLDIRGEFFNAFNHVQYADPATAYGTANFGHIQGTSVAPRIIQLAAKIQF
jgi:hypothetical protein